MARASQHYERSVEAFLIERRIPHLMVDDARRAVLPGPVLGGDPEKVKSVAAVVCGDESRGERSLLVEIKGRRVDLRRGAGRPGARLNGGGRRECWSTAEDVRSLGAWESLFGDPYDAVLLFWYWLDGSAWAASEQCVFRFEERAYAHRAVRLADYTRLMRVRSPRWGTVHLASEDFEAGGAPRLDLCGVPAGTVAGGAGSA